MTEKLHVQNEESFAEKCRLSLEKSWGLQIPIPNQCRKNKQKVETIRTITRL